jgi:hypothetical protein
MAAGGSAEAGPEAGAAEYHPPPAWQQFHKGYRERFVLDCVITLCNGAEVRVTQAPSAKRAAPQPQAGPRQPPRAAAATPVPRSRGVRGALAARARAAAPAQAGARASAKQEAAAAAAVATVAAAGAAAAQGGLKVDRESDPALTGSTVWDG